MPSFVEQPKSGSQTRMIPPALSSNIFAESTRNSTPVTPTKMKQELLFELKSDDSGDGKNLEQQPLQKKSSVNSMNSSAASLIHSLRTKVFILLCTIFLLFFFIFVAVLLIVFPPIFNELEAQAIKVASQRSSRGIYDTFVTTTQTLISYGAWNETYLIPIEQDPIVKQQMIDSYIELNVNGAAMENYFMNFFIMYDITGKALVKETYDFDTQEKNTLPIPSFLEELNSTDPILLGSIDSIDYRFNGMATYGSRVLLIWAGPIITSGFTGPASGVLLFATILSDSVIADLSTKTQLCLSFATLNETSNPVVRKMRNEAMQTKGIEINSASPDWNNNSPFVVENGSPNTFVPHRHCWGEGSQPYTKSARLFATSVFQDMFGQSTILMIVDSARQTLEFGMLAICVAIIMVALFIIFAVALLLSCLEFAIVKKVATLSSEVTGITKTKNIAKRVSVKTKDEIGKLAMFINAMLASLELTQTDLSSERDRLESLLHKMREEEKRTRAIMDSVPDYILVIDENGSVNYCNKSCLDAIGRESFESLHISKVLPEIDSSEYEVLANSVEEQVDTFLLNMVGAKIQVSVTINKSLVVKQSDAEKAYVVVARKEYEKSHKSTSQTSGKTTPRRSINLTKDPVISSAQIQRTFALVKMDEESSETQEQETETRNALVELGFGDCIEFLDTCKQYYLQSENRAEIRQTLLQKFLHSDSSVAKRFQESENTRTMFEEEKSKIEGATELEPNLFTHLYEFVLLLIIQQTMKQLDL